MNDRSLYRAWFRFYRLQLKDYRTPPPRDGRDNEFVKARAQYCVWLRTVPVYLAHGSQALHKLKSELSFVRSFDHVDDE